MNIKYKKFIAFIVLWFLGIVVWYVHGKNFAVLNPMGVVAHKERNLMILTVLLGSLVLIPVYIMTFLIAWRYREGNTKAKYSPEMTGNIFAEIVWWAIPTAIILVLSVVTWNSSHDLDPRKALNVSAKPITIEVVALDWKWLFIYPEQNVASVNQVEFPVNTPVNFEITSDAPMNSFWIPQLGGQIYAMPGMQSQLHLIANTPGSYSGSSANLSGDGFSGMRFTAISGSQDDFNNWVQEARRSPDQLDINSYRNLAMRSQNNPVAMYSTVDRGLFNKVLLKYMVPGQE